MTPNSLAASCEGAYRQIKYSDLSQVDKQQLLRFLDSILNEHIISELVRIEDVESNERIIDSIVGMFKFLSKEEIQMYSIHLVKLAGANSMLVLAIRKSEEQQEKIAESAKINLAIAFVVGITLVIGIIYLINNDNTARRIKPANDLMLPSSKFEGDSRLTPYPIRYCVGVIDPRFGLSKQKVLKLINEAVQVWQKPLALDLFRYDSLARFRINLKFDWRQETLNEEKRIRSQFISNGKTFDELREKYNSEFQIKERLEKEYFDYETELKRKLENYNSKVEMWNKTVGATDDEYRGIQQVRKDIDEMTRSLETKRLSLNEIVAKVNQLAESMNQLIAKKNLAIEYYNGRFVTGREFEVGTYDGQKIDLYQFEDDNDLRLLITHELGHALGFTHVDDPKAVMFYKSGQQDNKPIRLMNKDLELLVPIATKLRELSR